MVKFFRKHNKQLLAIVTVFLMVVFVGGSAFEAMLSPDPGQQVIGHAFGNEILQAQYDSFRNQTQILNRLTTQGYYFTWWRPSGNLQESDLDVYDYMLLVNEAVKAGGVPDLAKARARLSRQGKDLTEFRLNNRISEDSLETAVANFLLVQDSFIAAQQSMLPSELEIRSAIRQQYEKLNASIAVIDSKPLIDDQVQLDDADIAEHFESYREQTGSDQPLDFGYLIEDRIQVEYIKIDTQSIMPGGKITQRMAEKYWRDHQREFLRPKGEPEAPEEQDATEEATEESDSTDQAEESKPKKPYFETFAEAREQVYEVLNKNAQLEQAREMAEALRRRVIEPWYELAEDDLGFKVAADLFKHGHYYRNLIQDAKLAHPDSVKVGRTNFFGMQQAGTVDVLGSATEDTRTAAAVGRTFVSFVPRVKGFVNSSIAELSDRSMYLAMYQTAPVVLKDDQDNLYLFRPVAFQQKHAPESVDRVREQVVRDLHDQHAFDKAKSLAEQLVELVRENGPEQAIADFEGIDSALKETTLAWFEAEPFARRNQEIVPGFPVQPITIRDKGRNRDLEIASQSFADQAYELYESSGADAVGVIEVPELQKCFVIKLAGLEHVSKERYGLYKSIVQRTLNRTRLLTLADEWFSPDRIRDRAQWTPAS